jgi:hypothetical protein
VPVETVGEARPSASPATRHRRRYLRFADIASMNFHGIQRIYTFNTADFAAFLEVAALTP